MSESDHGVDLVEASAAYSAALDRNEADFTLSYGTVQNALTSDLTEAATTYEKGVVEALNALSLAEAKADLDRAVEIAEQQKANAIAAVQEEYGDAITVEYTIERTTINSTVAMAIADKLWRGTVTDAQSTFEDTVSALASAFEATVDARQKAATTDASRLVGELQVADAEALADYWSDKIEADNTQFSTDVDTSVDWKGDDYSAQADALAALNIATTAANDDNEVPWAKFLADKAAYVYNWWTDDSDPNTTCGSDLYRDWADDVNESYSAYATASGAACLSMAGTIAAANDTYYASTPDDNVEDDDDGDADDLPDVSPPDGAERWSAAMAEAESDYLDTLAAAELQLAVSTEAAGENAEQLADAQAAYDAAVSAAELAYQVAAARADGDAAVADAEAVDDYIDDVYGEDGDYDTWQSAISDAESAYETAASSAWSGLQKNLAAHDAALESALADTYAKAMEELADDFPGNPWAARAAADARAESDKIADAQSAQSAYADSVNDAQVAFDTALATAAATRTESQADALRTSLQTQSEAAVTKAENQAAADEGAAADGVGTAAVAESAEPKEAAEDLTEPMRDEDYWNKYSGQPYTSEQFQEDLGMGFFTGVDSRTLSAIELALRARELEAAIDRLYASLGKLEAMNESMKRQYGEGLALFEVWIAGNEQRLALLKAALASTKGKFEEDDLGSVVVSADRYGGDREVVWGMGLKGIPGAMDNTNIAGVGVESVGGIENIIDPVMGLAALARVGLKYIGTLSMRIVARSLARTGAGYVDDGIRLADDAIRFADDVARAPNSEFQKVIDEGISGIDDVIDSKAFRDALAADPTARRLYLRLRDKGVDVVLDHSTIPGNLAGQVVKNPTTKLPQIRIHLWNNSSTEKALKTFIHETRHADDILLGRTTFELGNSLLLEARAIRREEIWALGRKLTKDEWQKILFDLDVPLSGF